MYDHLSPYWDQKKLIFALGGEHTITVPLVKGVKKNYPDLVVLVLDAHADLRESWEGSSFSHACTLRRIAELDCPIFHLGLRSLSKEEQAFLIDRPQIRSYSSQEILFQDGLDRFRKELAPFHGQKFLSQPGHRCPGPFPYPRDGHPGAGGT